MSDNYFEHFGIEVGFQIDLEALRKKYLNISRNHHPDYAAGDDAAYEQALLMTSLNNQAYKTLSDFDERIKYVLEHLGHPISTDDKLDPEFLMEMMEWNERIMEAGMEEPEQIQTLSNDFQGLEEGFQQRMEAAIKAFETKHDDAELGRIKEIYLQRKYLLRLRTSIDKFARL
ncbi:MAG: Fe-S protein assembly co-chaperone HscB [Bacteroidia bacterium]|nr:Fe-S protein assembly co-chaperone HscB [Bacteroidia bacterium]